MFEKASGRNFILSMHYTFFYIEGSIKLWIEAGCSELLTILAALFYSTIKFY